MTDACSSTTAKMNVCRKASEATVAGRPFCAEHARESSVIMGQPAAPLSEADQ